MRWYSFTRMQKKVSRTFSRIITVSESAQNNISKDFKIPLHRFKIVPNGINTDLFYPIPGINRQKNRIIVTNSADIPLKGLDHLLQAIAIVSKTYKIKLIIIGTTKKNGSIEKLIKK